MVQANPVSGDGIVRDTPYGKWREDKEAEQGYSRELINHRIAPRFYDDLDSLPFLKEGQQTLLACFQDHVANRGD